MVAGRSWLIGLLLLQRLMIPVSISCPSLALMHNALLLIPSAVASFLLPPLGFDDWHWNHFLAKSPRLNLSHKKLGLCCFEGPCFLT
jgi:hypothetical protein